MPPRANLGAVAVAAREQSAEIAEEAKRKGAKLQGRKEEDKNMLSIDKF